MTNNSATPSEGQTANTHSPKPAKRRRKSKKESTAGDGENGGKKTTRKKKRGKKKGGKGLYIALALLGVLLATAVGGAILYKKQPRFTRAVDYVMEAVTPYVMDKSEKHIYGVDMSRYQKMVNWDKLALYYDKGKDTITFEKQETCIPVHFVFLKATQGRAQDPSYTDKRNQARKHGYKTGAYHILVNDTNIVRQAENFIATAQTDTSDFPPILDIESNMVGRPYSEYRQKVLLWLKTVEMETGGRPLIYCTDRVRENILSTPEFNKYHFWIARYGTTPPRSKDEWLFWQFSEKGRMRGLLGTVDVNLWRGTKKELEAWRKSCWSKDASQRKKIEKQLDKKKL